MLWIIAVILCLIVWILFFAEIIKSHKGAVSFSLIAFVFAFGIHFGEQITEVSISASTLEFKKEVETAKAYLDSIRVVRENIEKLADSIQKNTGEVLEAKQSIATTVTSLKNIAWLNAEITILRTQTRLMLGGIPEPVRSRLGQDIDQLMAFAEPNKQRRDSLIHVIDKILRDAGGQPILK